MALLSKVSARSTATSGERDGTQPPSTSTPALAPERNPHLKIRGGGFVDDLLPSLWRTTLTEYPSALNAHELLTFCTQMTGDPRPWLAVWSAIGGVPAARQLADFMTRCYHFTWGLLTDFDEDAVKEEILRWLVRDGRAILAALPKGAELDAARALFARWEKDLAWLSS